MPFSSGPRACIGRKFVDSSFISFYMLREIARRFFETEGIAVLTMLVLKYRITVKEEPEFANETFEEKKARVTQSRPGLTLTPTRVPLTFTRR